MSNEQGAMKEVGRAIWTLQKNYILEKQLYHNWKITPPTYVYLFWQKLQTFLEKK